MKNTWAIALLAIAPQVPLQAAHLTAAAIGAWDDYVRLANERIQQRGSANRPFLWIDEVPERAAKVRRGEIVVLPAAPHTPRKIPSALIHDWIGGTFIPGLTIHDALSVVRDYDRYKEFYRPNVIDSKAISTSDSEDRFSAVLMNQALFEKTALESEYLASYVPVGDRKLYSISKTTRIREVAGYGTPGERLIPEDEGAGLIWRLYSVLRFEERDGGLYVEVEAIALSRDIPAALRLVIEPIVRRVSRDALITALHQTDDALHSAAAVAAANHHPTSRPSSTPTLLQR